MKNKNLIILYKEVGKDPVLMKIENSLEEKEKLVGGKIEVIPFENILICCNEDLQVNKIKPNIAFKFSSIYGNCFVIAEDEYTGEFKSLAKDEAIKYYSFLKKNSFSYENCDENGRILSRAEISKKRRNEKLKWKYKKGQERTYTKDNERIEKKYTENSENQKLEEKNIYTNKFTKKHRRRRKIDFRS